MNESLNRTPRFRTDLKREIPIWLREGIVTEDTARQLAERYDLEALKKESSHLLAAVLFTIGGLLLGGGVISFVAANWEEIPDSFKIVLLLGALIGLHGFGYWLREKRGWTRLGHALIFLGCLIFGANIALFAQIFHISGSWYGGFFAWAIGSLIMAWAARSWIIGVLTLMTSFVWFCGYVDAYHNGLGLAYPFAIAIALLPLAWMIRSRVLYVLTFTGIIAALAVITGEDSSARFVMLAIAIGGFMAWAVGEWHRASGIHQEFGNWMAGLGITALAVSAYIWSFRELWNPLGARELDRKGWIIPVVIAALIGIVFLVRAWSIAQSERHLLQAGLAIAALFIAVSVFIGQSQISYSFHPVIVTNLAAFALAAVAIWNGIVDERRIAFWLGSVFVVLLIISRFLEYETSLLIKSLAFIVCGIAVMLAGTSYERYLRRKEAIQ